MRPFWTVSGRNFILIRAPVSMKMPSDTSGTECDVTEAVGTDLPWVREAVAQCALLAVSPEDLERLGRDTIVNRALSEYQRLRDSMAGPTATFVAKSPVGERLGMVLVMTTFEANSGESVGWIVCLYVAPEHRSKGVGRRLMSEAESWARSMSLRKMALTVGPVNEQASRLYETMGYSVESLYMAKSL